MFAGQVVSTLVITPSLNLRLSSISDQKLDTQGCVAFVLTQSLKLGVLSQVIIAHWLVFVQATQIDCFVRPADALGQSVVIQQHSDSDCQYSLQPR